MTDEPTRPVRVVELDRPPAAGVLLRRAAIGALPALPGQAGSGTGDGLPGVEYHLSGLLVSRSHLAGYDRVCGFRLADELPATYPHVLAFPLALTLLTRADFPLPLAGLVHLANRITVHRPVDAGEPLDLAVRAADLRPHRRGRQFDVLATARVDDEVVWHGVSTYLCREGARRGGGTGRAPGTPPPGDPVRTTGAAPPGDPVPPADPLPTAGAARWRVPAPVGTRYARISGDRNPIHTSTLGARLFGFRRRIAHGMWTKARCLAALEGRLPPAYTVDVAFQAPVPLPAAVSFAASRTTAGWRFAVADPDSGRSHLTGRTYRS